MRDSEWRAEPWRPIRSLYDAPARRGHERLKTLARAVALALVLVVSVVGAKPVGAQERFDVSSRGSRAAIEETIALYFPAEAVPRALRIAQCESNLDPWAIGFGWYRGLFQIDPELHQAKADAMFGRGASLYSTEVNIAVAAWLYAESGWRPWPVCGLR